MIASRMNRATYWLWLVVAVPIIVAVKVKAPKYGVSTEVLLPSLCVPRLHDIGRSGWWVVAPALGEFIPLIGLFFIPMNYSSILTYLSILILWGFFIWLGTVPGQSGPNRFGEQPRPLFRRARSAS